MNSFGLSGTNAHVVLEGYGEPADGADHAGDGRWPMGPEQTVAVGMPDVDAAEVTEGERPERPVRVLPLSARSPATLTEMAGKYLAWLDELEASAESAGDVARVLADAAWTAGTGRSHFEHRAGLVFSDAAELRAALDRLAGSDAVADEEGLKTPARTAFVYTSDDMPSGSTMKALYETEPVVRAVLDTCDRVVREECGASLLDTVLAEGAGNEATAVPELERAGRFAAQAALTALWRSVGVRPAAVLGLGLSELAAAYGAGVLGLADGVRLAMALGSPDAELPRTANGQPSATMVSSVLGRAVQPSDDLGDAHWRKLASESASLPACVAALADTGVDLAVVMGAAGDPLEALWPREKQAPRLVTFVEAAGQSAFAEAVAKPTGPAHRSPSRGSLRASRGAGSRCPATRSSAGASGSSALIPSLGAGLHAV